MIYSLNPATSIALSVTTGASQAVTGLDIRANTRWLVTVDQTVMIAQGTDTALPTAAIANGSMLVVPGYPAIVDGRCGNRLAAMRASASNAIMTVTQLLD